MSEELPAIIAHRGAARLAPENTYASMRQAKIQGAKWIEFDTQLTHDNVAIVFHDAKLQRTSNGRGKVANSHYKQLQSLDAGSWFSEQFSDQRIPLLKDYLCEAAKLKLGVNIELKASAATATTLAKQVLQLLETHWSTQLPQPLLSSFSYKSLLAIRQLCHTCRLGLNVKSIKKKHLQQASTLNCYSIHMTERYFNKKIQEINTQFGFKTLVYTVNDRETAQALLHSGVTSVFSDNEALFSLTR